MNFIINIILKLLTFIAMPAMKGYCDIALAAPKHCGKPTEFTGNLCTLTGELLFYRCTECGQEFTRVRGKETAK